MFTEESVREEIRKFAEDEMTPLSTELLAHLMIIYDHRHLLPSGEEEDKDDQREWADRMENTDSTTKGHWNREMAQEWVHGMKNTDGTTGPHWTMEKTEEVRAQRGINCEPLAFWVAMNMIYSDYAKVAEKINANSIDFYAYMAKAFLEDKDVRNQGAEKLARYYKYVVL